MEPIELDVARMRRAFASAPGEGRGAVDSERIFDALHGDMTVEDRRVMVDELLSDADAAESWRLALDLAPAPEAKPRVLSARGAWMSMAAVAAVLLMVAGSQLTRPRQAVDIPTYRGLNGASIAPVPPSDATIRRVSPTLRWTAAAGGRYRVRVLTADLEMIAVSEELTLTEYTLQPSVVDRMPEGIEVLWQVTVRLPDGTVVESPTFRARVV